MIDGFVQLIAAILSQNEAHDEFLELCAIATSGELAPEDREKLDNHLAVCSRCREALVQYQDIVDQDLPIIAAMKHSEDISPGPGWSQEQAEKRLLEQTFPKSALSNRRGTVPGQSHGASTRQPSAPPGRAMALLYAAGIVLIVAFGVLAYRAGIRRGNDLAEKSQVPSPRIEKLATDALEAELSDLSHENELAQKEIARRDKMISNLRAELDRESVVTAHMKAAEEQLTIEAQASGRGKDELAKQQSELAEELKAAQTRSLDLQGKIDLLTKKSAEDMTTARAHEGKIADLTRLLQERDLSLQQQAELLSHDRDIRDLMGARDLYMAEVYDIAATGETRKPFGRVFFTKGKSLIFYAYDLDQQSVVKRVGAFQAWGRRGPDRQNAVNLGVFYQDNAARKRWILKCDDSDMLANIDAVFVTVEPNGGSRKPSTKPLLFAYLKVNPNHP